jgi:uncharacterized protein (DUF1697 family)
MRYLALLRGINVGGKNKVNMQALKAVFEQAGFKHVVTYISSGNVLFSADAEPQAVRIKCEALLAEHFQVNNPVGVLRADAWAEAVENAPTWWGAAPDAAHNAMYVLPPLTAEEAIAQVGQANAQYEQIAHCNNIIFWSAMRKGYSRTQWSKMMEYKSVYQAITIRNYHTALALANIHRRDRDE